MSTIHTKPTEIKCRSGLDRRTLLFSGLAAAGLVSVPLVRQLWKPRSSAFIAKNQTYDAVRLQQTIRDGLIATGLDSNSLKGKRVLLKPNLVEPLSDAPHLTTHPTVVGAAAEVFRQWGAVVSVGEGPGHVRDAELALVESGLDQVLTELGLPFVDLNHDEVGWVKNAGRSCQLEGFYFPRAAVETDIIVSMPKMKTHHWVGVTAAMKNLYGVIPGLIYGWPKNVLHHNGVPNTVFDISASLPKTLAIVDGILCMEGDGPIMGTPKEMGLVVVGTNPTAVDATICRLMGISPDKVGYLQLAADRLGPIADRRIEQRGELWQPLKSPFQILDKPHLTQLRLGKRVS